MRLSHLVIQAPQGFTSLEKASPPTPFPRERGTALEDPAEGDVIARRTHKALS